MNDPHICDNPLFWSDYPCPDWAYQCTGRNNGQCGTLSPAMATCDDKSDQVDNNKDEAVDRKQSFHEI